MADLERKYEDRDAQAVLSVLVEVGQILGAYSQRFVVVGGAVPWLLLSGCIPAHIGTNDGDLVLDADAFGDGEYATIIELLMEKGYERDLPGLKQFQIRRWVTVDDGEPVAVLVDFLMPRKAKGPRNKKKLLANFRVLRIDGGDIALRNCTPKTITGRMPDGRNNSVEILVATIPALLVMKGFAITGRDKQKDAYDIYYSIRNYDTGLKGLAEDCQPLLDFPEARLGLEKLASKFRDPTNFGPQTVRKFCVEHDALGEMTADQIQQDAFGQVDAFIRHLGLSNDPNADSL